MLSVHAIIALGVTAVVFLILQVRRRAPTDLLFLSALMLVTLTGTITPTEALSGFANPAVLTIAGLLVVAAGLRSAGVLDWIGTKLLGDVSTERAALRRLAPTIVIASAFMLNTALVAMMMPVIIDWCRRRNISPSRMLMPLSYLAILGGVCTLIGTSTTLVVNGELRALKYKMSQVEQSGDADAVAALPNSEFRQQAKPMSLFELGSVGLPCAIVGTIFLLTIGRKLLPNRRDIVEDLGEHRREYLVEMLVQEDCVLIGKTIGDAGLRSLPGLFLIEINRSGDIITPVTPRNIVRPGDRLVFTGVVSTIVDLEKIPGLVPAADLAYEVNPRARSRRMLTEVVLSRTSPLIGLTVRTANFRQRYNAAVVAVHRNGVRLTNKIGDIALEPGDTLLLQTQDAFVQSYRNNRDFYLVSGVEGSRVPRRDKLSLAMILLVVLIGWLSLTSFLVDLDQFAGFASTGAAAITIAALMVITRCLRPSEARNAIDLQTLVTIAAALGLGRALTASGAAEAIAQGMIGQIGANPTLLLIMIYLLALGFTETITNNAVAAMLLPIALAVALASGFSPRPFIIAITLAASLSFITPIGYQTNLMVMGPGGYRPTDYLRCGLPLALVVTIVSLTLIPLIWPF